MGVPFYLVASATKLIMAQRMCRKICSNCKEEINLTAEQVEGFGDLPKDVLRNIRAFKGKGCRDCNNTGKAGRTGIFEVMPITREIEQLILEKATDTQIRAKAIEQGMYSLRMSAIEKMKAGQIDIDEVFAVTS
jgi:type IV pilus assembly protein PilB